MNPTPDHPDALLEDARERLEWPRLLQILASEAILASVRERLEHSLPVLPADDRRVCFDATDEMLHIISDGSPFELHDTALNGFLPLARRSALLSPVDLYEVLKLTQMLQGAAQFARPCRDDAPSRFPCLREIFKGVVDLPTLRMHLARSVDGGGTILSTASPELDSARRRVDSHRRRIVAIVDDLLQSTAVRNALQDPIWMERDGHIVLPVRADRRTEISGVPRGVSGSGQTIFVEPQQVLQAQGLLESALAEAQIEENRVIRALSEEVHASYEDLARGAAALEQFDEIHARARFASKMRATRPVMRPVSQSPCRFSFEGARHPLFMAEDRDCVPNDLALEPQFEGDSEKLVWVLTGPNAGGKTVAMRTVGLTALMALSGLFVCCDRAVLCEFDGVFVELGDRQSREENLSTFSGHLLHVRRILSRATEASLVLLDEGFVGTDPAVGMALARGALEFLADVRATTIITTHFSNLKLLANEDPRFLNASMEFEPRELRPTYRLINGIPGQSFALELAKRIDFPEAILAKARAYHGVESHRMELLLAELQERRSEIDRELASQVALRHKLKEEFEAIRTEKSTLARARDGLVEEYRGKLVKRLRAFENRLEVRERQFERAQQENIEKAAAALQAALPAETLPEESRAKEIPAKETRANETQAKAKDSHDERGSAKRRVTSFADLGAIRLPTGTASNDSKLRQDDVDRRAAEFRPPKQMSRRALEDEARESLEVLNDSFDDIEREFRGRVGKRLQETAPSAEAHEVRREVTATVTSTAPSRPLSFWRPGVRVKCGRFSEVGEVVRAADPKGFVECKFGYARVKIPASELMTVEDAGRTAVGRGPVASKKQPQVQRPKHREERHNLVDTSIEGTMQHGGNTVDVRGLTVDEALEKAERFADKACRDGEQRIIIVHGHGSGRVKAAIREWLVKARYELSFRPGTHGEGGDGATVVQFKT